METPVWSVGDVTKMPACYKIVQEEKDLIMSSVVVIQDIMGMGSSVPYAESAIGMQLWLNPAFSIVQGIESCAAAMKDSLGTDLIALCAKLVIPMLRN